ncbi:hypothetical protein GOV07_05275 [Candidatus Woesearchaeota archaeon]|nr:hypothetical protein [Candidatus Woesearchaeota archaeon]
MKKILMIIAALAAIMTLSLAAVAFENHVRWNNQLNECVYFFEDDGTSVSCYVPEEYCEGKTSKDLNKDADTSTCYYIPRSQQDDMVSGVCEEFVEGDLIVLQYDGQDPDLDELTYTFGAPFDTNQRWQTVRGDAGTYDVKVTVTDGQFSDQASVCFTILEANHPPVLSVSSITVKEGQIVKLKPTCSDEDGDAVKIEYNGWMTKSSKELSFEDAGVYSVTVKCTDTDGEFDSKTIQVTVEDVDRDPLVSGARDVTVSETETVKLTSTCTDPDGTETSMTYSGDMTSASWKTGYEDSGVYSVTITCEDGTGRTTSQTVSVTVEERNRPPTITAMVVRG